MPSPTLKWVFAPMCKKTSTFFRKRSSVFNTVMSILRQPQVGLWVLKSPIRSNGDISCSTRSCVSSVRHIKSGKYTQQLVMFSGCNKLIASIFRGVARRIHLAGYVLLRNIATPLLVLMFLVTSQQNDSCPS